MKNYRCHVSKHAFCYSDDAQKGQKTLRDCLVECNPYDWKNEKKLEKIDAPEYRIRRAYSDLVGDILHPRCLKERDNLIRMLENVRIAQEILRLELKSSGNENMKQLDALTTALFSRCDVAFLIWYLTKPYPYHANQHLQNRLHILTHKHHAVEYRAFLIDMLSRTSACYSKKCAQLIKADMFQAARTNLLSIQASEFGRYLLNIFDRILEPSSP